MHCGQCQGIESVFDKRRVDRELADYRRNGPSRTTQLLVEGLLASGVREKAVLDIGGGIGAIQSALLAAGAAEAVHVDASTSYLRAAREEADKQGYSDRVRWVHGDFVSLAGELAPADIVTMDRVLCCYHDMPALLGAAAGKAHHLLGLVYPRDRWWLKVAFPFLNAAFRLRRNPFRIYLHSTEAVSGLLKARHFKPVYTRRTLLWQVYVYERTAQKAE